MPQSIVLIGGGGHCHSIIDLIEGHETFEVFGILERERSKIGNDVFGCKVVGIDDDMARIFQSNENFIITIGQIRNSKLRQKLFEMAVNSGGKPCSVYSKWAHISGRCQIEKGVTVGHFSTVNIGARIGINTIINNHVLVEHDVSIGKHCHLATGAIINGNVDIGNNTFVGSQATIIQSISICDDVVIGAGSVITKNITSPGVYAGAPARKIK